MVYTIAEELLRIFKGIDIDFNLGLWTSSSSNHSLFKVCYCFSEKINLAALKVQCKWGRKKRRFVMVIESSFSATGIGEFI